MVLNPEIVDETKLSNQEKQSLSEFDNEIEILVKSLQDENLKLRKVSIPEYLNVTKSIKLIRNSKDFAEKAGKNCVRCCSDCPNAKAIWMPARSMHILSRRNRIQLTKLVYWK